MIDHAMSIDPRFALERFGNDPHPKMGFTPGPGLRMACVAVAVVYDLELARQKGMLQLLCYSLAEAARLHFLHSMPLLIVLMLTIYV